MKKAKKVTVSEVKDDLAGYLRRAERQDIIITRRGKPVGVLIGFTDASDWDDYTLENDARFHERIAAARASLRAGRGVRLEDVNG